MAYQGRINPERLVFIDETWTKTNMSPLRGWAPLGQRLNAKVPQGRWQTMTFLAALRHDRIDAPCLIDGPINGDSFLPISSKFSFPRSSLATSSSSTILDPTRERPCAAQSALSGQSSSSFPSIRPTSTPSKCSSPSPNIGSEKPPEEPLMLSVTQSLTSCQP